MNLKISIEQLFKSELDSKWNIGEKYGWCSLFVLFYPIMETWKVFYSDSEANI